MQITPYKQWLLTLAFLVFLFIKMSICLLLFLIFLCVLLLTGFFLLLFEMQIDAVAESVERQKSTNDMVKYSSVGLEYHPWMWIEASIL